MVMKFFPPKDRRRKRESKGLVWARIFLLQLSFEKITFCLSLYLSLSLSFSLCLCLSLSVSVFLSLSLSQSSSLCLSLSFSLSRLVKRRNDPNALKLNVPRIFSNFDFLLSFSVCQNLCLAQDRKESIKRKILPKSFSKKTSKF